MCVICQKSIDLYTTKSKFYDIKFFLEIIQNVKGIQSEMYTLKFENEKQINKSAYKQMV